MRVVIIDDDSINIDLIKMFCEKFAPNLIVVGSATTVDSGIELIIREKPNLVFLDVEIHDKTGFDVLKSVNDPDMFVVMITAFAAYAVDAFKVNVIDYLLKPLLIPDFIKAVEKCQYQYDLRKREPIVEQLVSDEYIKFINVQEKDSVLLIPIEQVVRFEADRNYSKLYTKNSMCYVVSKALYLLEPTLSPSLFLRVHNSHIINLKAVKSLQRQKEGGLILQDGSIVPIAERRRKDVLSQIGSNL